MLTVGLVACCGKKLGHAAPARELYTSALFRKAASYAERTYDLWFIVSAKYGLVHPDTVIEPYEQRIKGSRSDRYWWATSVLGRLGSSEAVRGRPYRIYAHAGADYIEPLAGVLLNVRRPDQLECPMRSMSIGRQLKFYTEQETMAKSKTKTKPEPEAAPLPEPPKPVEPEDLNDSDDLGDVIEDGEPQPEPKKEPQMTTPKPAANDPTPALTAETPSLSYAIREALIDLGVETATNMIRDYITDKYPGLADSLNTPTFGSTLSNQRKKLREGGSGDSGQIRTRRPSMTPTQPAPARVVTSSEEPTMSDLLAVKAAIDGGLDEALLDEVLALIEKLGTVGKIRKAIDFWANVK